MYKESKHELCTEIKQRATNVERVKGRFAYL